MVKSASGKSLTNQGNSHLSMLQPLRWRVACLLGLGVLIATFVSVAALVLRGMRCSSRRHIPPAEDPLVAAAHHEEEGLINMSVHSGEQPSQREAQCRASRTVALLTIADRQAASTNGTRIS